MRAILIPFLLTLITACVSVSTTRTHFYSLAGTDAAPARPMQSSLSVGLGPLDFPAMLDRPQIVTRTRDHRVSRAEYHQWAGSLKREFMRTLADRLEAELGSSRIQIYPWTSRQRPEYQIRLDVSRFDGALNGKVILNVRWQLLSAHGKKEARVGRSHIEMEVDGDSYEAYVEALSQAVAAFAKELAQILTHRRQ